MTLPSDPDAFVKKYSPLLVLYPEIRMGETREKSKNSKYPDEAPLLYDYHPRDIRIVLANSSFHARIRLWGNGKSSWRRMLDRMEGKRYRRNIDVLPGVQSDDRDRFWDEYAAIIQVGDEHHRRACYARVVPGSGVNEDRLLVQYWYAYFYNDFWNAHEMDWETVMIVFKTTDGEPIPIACACSAHFKGSWLPWSQVEKAAGGDQPVIYVAHGSHANYFYGPHKYVTIPDAVNNVARHFNRESRGLGDFTTSKQDGSTPPIEVTLIHDQDEGPWEGDLRWLNQEGLWGSPGEWDLEFGDSGPKGPPKAGDRWDRPFRWINNTCTRAPSPKQLQVPTRLEPGAP